MFRNILSGRLLKGCGKSTAYHKMMQNRHPSRWLGIWIVFLIVLFEVFENICDIDVFDGVV